MSPVRCIVALSVSRVTATQRLQVVATDSAPHSWGWGGGFPPKTRGYTLFRVKKFPLPGKHVMLITKGVRIVLSGRRYECQYIVYG